MYKEIANTLVSKHEQADGHVFMDASVIIEGEPQNIRVKFDFEGSLTEFVVALMESICVTQIMRNYYVEDGHRQDNQERLGLLDDKLHAAEVRYSDNSGINGWKRRRSIRKSKADDLPRRGTDGKWSFLYE